MVTLLRTLTLKSRLKFGRYYLLTVSTVFAKQKINYLIWVYYNMSKITFDSVVLKKLGIQRNQMIAKPGINKELGFIVNTKIKSNFSEHVKKKIKDNIRLEAKNRLKGMKEDGNWTKAGLARRNQGH